MLNVKLIQWGAPEQHQQYMLNDKLIQWGAPEQHQQYNMFQVLMLPAYYLREGFMDMGRYKEAKIYKMSAPGFSAASLLP